MDKRIKSVNGELVFAWSCCSMQFALWRNERRIHTCCALVVTCALLIGGFSCQNYNRTIVCSTTTFCKALEETIRFRNKSLASALCACFSVQHKSLCGLKNDVQYTHVTCACCEQCTLLCGFFRKIQLLLWPTQLAVVAPKFNDAFSDVDHSGLTL